MNKSKRFKPIVKLAQSREKEAAKVLGQSQQVLSAQEIRLSELKMYRAEYVESLHSAGGQGMSIEQMRNYRSFLDNLEKAIEQQEHVVNQAVSLVDKDKSDWVNSLSRRKVLDKVVDKYKGEEQRHMDKAEQRETDDRTGKPKT